MGVPYSPAGHARLPTHGKIVSKFAIGICFVSAKVEFEGFFQSIDGTLGPTSVVSGRVGSFPPPPSAAS
jgi:hypothetical protein